MRRVASSRIRCVTVIASVLAITKLPTNSAIPPKPSRKYLMKFRPSCVSSLSAAACAVAVFTCVVSETNGVICPASSSSETPSSAPTRIRSNLPSLSKSRCAVEIEDGDRDPAERPFFPKRTSLLIVYSVTGPHRTS